ncbi:MAG: GntR family transcriptional regulator, partial [Comamonadaceae bacterium]
MGSVNIHVYDLVAPAVRPPLPLPFATFRLLWQRRVTFIAGQVVYAYNRRVPTSSLTQTTSSAVIQLLRQSLDRGRWSPGEPLRQEEIAAELGVSRVPVREAFFQLQAEGLVQVVPNKGVYVR